MYVFTRARRDAGACCIDAASMDHVPCKNSQSMEMKMAANTTETKLT
jgi:hypothetical protein